MTWILFILVFRTSPGIAVDHIEFTSKAACVGASQIIRQGLKEYTIVTMSCVPKN